ncbi:MAG: phage head-tail connector protein [Chitinophagaceae bacterium]|nr:phage head-tail connector protein [Chitinophagaceae bacterium]
MPSNQYYIEDFLDAKRNRITVLGSGSGPAYNAVISVVFSDEATAEPILLQEAKDWLRIDVTDDDGLITKLIKAARIVCENYANLSFINRTVTAKIHNGLGNFYLPYGPVMGDIVHIADTDDVELSDYNVNDAYADDIIVTYDAGYEVLPENFRTAILDQVSFMYSSRGDSKVASGLSLESILVLNQYRNI